MNQPPIPLMVALLLWTPVFIFSFSLTPDNLNYDATKNWLALFAAQNQAEERPPLVKVYENAFNPSACEMLHYLAVDHHERTNDGSSTFDRPPHNRRPLTPLENAIDSALTEMGDETKLVEYWSRDEYMNVDAHTDIDEVMLEEKGKLRCPLESHVLYLEVKDGIVGPTCVFPGEQIGWGQNEQSGNKNKEKELVIVPAVQGRILRFPGGAMHAVPNPAHRWLMSKEEEKALRDEEGNSDYEEWLDEEAFDDMDEDDDCDDEIERSVLLFNTWADEEPGPQGVNGDSATGALPEGIELSKEDASAFLKSQEEQIFAQWEEEYGKGYQAIICNPFSEWKAVSIQNIEEARSVGDSTSPETVNVSLMGTKKRRLYPKQYAALQGPKDQVDAALREASKVSGVRLQIDD